jgi:hypothetical protein
VLRRGALDASLVALAGGGEQPIDGAEKVDVVCLTRPTGSAIAYEQMVGRGLRGPRNGGTAECLVLDVQDEGLPESVMSYARVVRLWNGA